MPNLHLDLDLDLESILLSSKLLLCDKECTVYGRRGILYFQRFTTSFIPSNAASFLRSSSLAHLAFLWLRLRPLQPKWPPTHYLSTSTFSRFFPLDLHSQYSNLSSFQHQYSSYPSQSCAPVIFHPQDGRPTSPSKSPGPCHTPPTLRCYNHSTTN